MTSRLCVQSAAYWKWLYAKGTERLCTQTLPIIYCYQLTRALLLLSQGESHDAAVNFDTYRILQRRHAVFFATATAQLFCVHQRLCWNYRMLIYTLRNYSLTHSLVYMAMMQNHADSQKSHHTTKIVVKATMIVNMWLSYSDNYFGAAGE